jgi:hypothetical protein
MAIIDRDSIWKQTTRTQPFQSIRMVFSLAWSQGKTALAVIGAAVYAVTRTSLDGFYARLGLTPEDVGLTEAKILGRATLYFAAMAAAFLLLVSVLLILIQFFFSISE